MIYLIIIKNYFNKNLIENFNDTSNNQITFTKLNDSNIKTDVPGLSPTDLSQLQDHAMYMNNYSIPTGTSTAYTPGHQSSIAQPIIYNEDGTSTKTITRPRSGASGAAGAFSAG